MNRELLLLETIRLTDGVLYNLPIHERRMQQSAFRLWGEAYCWKLSEIIHIPDDQKKGLYKVRITYGMKQFMQEIESYTPKPVNTLKLVRADDIIYDLKFKDRSALEKLSRFKGDCDEILMVKNGLITDTSYSNVAFFDGKQWWTPESPLLAGTQRAKLLEEGLLKEATIRPEDLKRYREIKLINAMMDPLLSRSIPVENIF